MVSQDILDVSITAALEHVSAEFGLGRVAVQPRGGICLQGSSRSLCLLGVPRTNEIEWWVESPDWETSHIGSDVIQEWLGEPITAFQFNDSDYDKVVQTVCELGTKALAKFDADRRVALDGLAAAESRIDARSKSRRLREEAKEAWARGNYAAFKRIILELSDPLTPVESKRLEIAERNLAEG